VFKNVIEVGNFTERDRHIMQRENSEFWQYWRTLESCTKGYDKSSLALEGVKS